jgi:hypothetical protein
MSGMPLETCWAFNERWNNKFYYKVASCWLFLLNHTTMHGSMNIKCIYMYVRICTCTGSHHTHCVYGLATGLHLRENKNIRTLRSEKNENDDSITQPVPQEHLLLFELSTAQLCFICWKCICSTVNTHSHIHSFNRQKEYVAPTTKVSKKTVTLQLPAKHWLCIYSSWGTILGIHSSDTLAASGEQCCIQIHPFSLSHSRTEIQEGFNTTSHQSLHFKLNYFSIYLRESLLEPLFL